MKRLFCEIKIGTETFRFVNQVTIESTWKTFTDTGNLTIPGRLRKDGVDFTVGESFTTKQGVKRRLFKRGDSITINLGYYPTLQTVFEGYVSKVVPGSPAMIFFEDASWKLKQDNLNFSSKKISLSELLDEIVTIGSINVEAVEADLGSFRVSKVNAIQVLQELKKTYGLVSWFRRSTLYCGLAYRPELSYKRTFFLNGTGCNVIDDGNNLEYRNSEDVRIKVKAISMLPDNRKLSVEVGDPDGEQRTFTAYNITSEAELRRIAERELPKYQYNGFAGSFMTFGEPFVRHGDVAQLVDRKNPEKSGDYLIDQVTTTFGDGIGYRQEISIARKVSETGISA